jgi:fibronectin-binding autotransporter adhesin
MMLLAYLVVNRKMCGRAFSIAITRCAPVIAMSLILAIGSSAYGVDINWTGATSSLIYNNGTATGNWTPSDPPTGVQATGENWIFPDATTLGTGSTTPSFDSGGMLTVGGTGLGGITFQAGAPAYTFTQTDIANILNLAGSTNTSSSTDRGIITNNSTSKQTFNMDVISTRATIDAKSGDIEFSAGHTFTTGGPSTLSLSSGNANSMTTIFQGDHNIYLNSNVVQTVLGSAGTSGRRGQLRYLGADTVAANAGALILGDLGTYGGPINVDSVNGGIVRATKNNSFGASGFTTQVGTTIGTSSTGSTSNGVVEIDGSAGDLTIPESFRISMRTLANGATHMRNVAGNNTITGFVSFNNPLTAAPDSAFIELVSGKLTITGTLSNDRPNVATNLYVKGAGSLDIGGVDGITQTGSTATSFLNIDKTGAGTITTLAGTTNNYSGTATIHEGAFIMNGTHTTANSGSYVVDAPATVGGKGITSATVNLSGKIAPGEVNSVGTLTVGGVSLTGGILDFQLNATNPAAGGGINDLIVDSGALDLSGGATLNVTTIGGNLTVGDYDLIQFAGALTGTSSNVALGTIPLGAGLSASIQIDSDSVNLHIAAGLAGDYNSDGKVDASDYVLWRKNPNVVGGGNPVGYNTWRSNFGAGGPGAGNGLGGASSAVPEPTVATLVAMGTILLILRRAPNRRSTERVSVT